MNRQLIILISILWMAGSGICFASRSVYTVPINLFSIYRFNQDSSGATISTLGSQYGNRAGTKLALEINLMNITPDSTQQVTIEIVPNTLDAQSDCSSYSFSGKLILCNADWSGTHSDALTTAPAAITYTIPAQSAVKMSLISIASGTYGSPSTNSSCNMNWAELTAAFKITVKEDQGAIIGSVTPKTFSHSDSSTVTVCGWNTLQSQSWSGNFPPSPGIPVQINGGRPF